MHLFLLIEAQHTLQAEERYEKYDFDDIKDANLNEINTRWLGSNASALLRISLGSNRKMHVNQLYTKSISSNAMML